ncbi:hypothetical protein LJC20_02210 [Eubacteriales bacterium OttesenSCG-928-M02]|nr:hypothetical protein [Eubacteriales bacterium OttesenSCG-928-M02]
MKRYGAMALLVLLVVAFLCGCTQKEAYLSQEGDKQGSRLLQAVEGVISEPMQAAGRLSEVLKCESALEKLTLEGDKELLTLCRSAKRVMEEIVKEARAKEMMTVGLILGEEADNLPADPEQGPNPVLIEDLKSIRDKIKAVLQKQYQ